MKLRLHHVDAFAEARFRGNPAAVVVLPSFPDARWLQAVADENRLSETAYVVSRGAPGEYDLRWFTPTTEVDLCGHATLASAWVLWERRGETAPVLRFHTRSGELRVGKRADGRLELDFPARRPVQIVGDPVGAALGRPPVKILDSGVNYLAIYASEADVRALRPDFRALRKIPRHAVSASARGDSADFVSRFFAPGAGVDEDPVTGSSHTELVPYWAKELGKTELHARQVSARGGELLCRLDADRVFIAGHVTPYLDGEIDGPD
ncbi:MAG TPA: PhzF family phenazine biosynthesis protein [Polyangiaceae bacterium]|nr:PhzF family phenazine biosynthesis protein [Polyangiaceae bacterium]